MQKASSENMTYVGLPIYTKEGELLIYAILMPKSSSVFSIQSYL